VTACVLLASWGCGKPEVRQPIDALPQVRELATFLAESLPRGSRVLAVGGFYDLDERRQSEYSAELEVTVERALGKFLRLAAIPRWQFEDGLRGNPLFRQAWFLDDALVRKAGEILEVQWFVVGTHRYTEGRVDLSLRVIDVKTGEVLAEAAGPVPADSWTVMKMMREYPLSYVGR